MKPESTYEAYMQDTVKLILDEAVEVAADRDREKRNSAGWNLNAGINMGLLFALSTMRNQTIAFRINPAKIGLGRFTLEKELARTAPARAKRTHPPKGKR